VYTDDSDKFADFYRRSERKILRKIYDPVCNRGIWRIGTTEELNNLHQNRYILTDFKLRRLEWLSHLIRMENNIIPKIVLGSKLDGEKKN
jgi:hypothetical protein